MRLPAPSTPVALPALRALRLQGRDVLPYLHTKLTTDVRSWESTPGGPALAVDINGRMIAAGLLLQEEAEASWLWLVPAPHHEVLQRHLERFVIMEDVTITPIDDRRWYLLPRQAAEALGATTLPAALGVAAAREGVLITAQGLSPWEKSTVLVGVPEADEAAQVRRWTDALGEPLSAQALREAQIRAATASFPEDLHAGETLPIEAGAWSMIALNKGCYLGQEVIERLFARGRPNKRLMVLRWQGPPVDARHKLVSGGRESGWVTGSVAVGDETLAMGYVRRRWLDAPTTPLLLEDLDIPVEVGDYVGGESPPPERR